MPLRLDLRSQWLLMMCVCAVVFTSLPFRVVSTKLTNYYTIRLYCTDHRSSVRKRILCSSAIVVLKGKKHGAGNGVIAKLEANPDYWYLRLAPWVPVLYLYIYVWCELGVAWSGLRQGKAGSSQSLDRAVVNVMSPESLFPVLLLAFRCAAVVGVCRGKLPASVWWPIGRKVYLWSVSH